MIYAQQTLLVGFGIGVVFGFAIGRARGFTVGHRDGWDMAQRLLRKGYYQTVATKEDPKP